MELTDAGIKNNLKNIPAIDIPKEACGQCYKTFFRGNLDKLDSPFYWNNKEYGKLDAINSIFYLKIKLDFHSYAGLSFWTNFIQYFSLGESRFPPKMFVTLAIAQRLSSWLQY